MTDQRKQIRRVHAMHLQELVLAMALGMMVAGWAIESAYLSWKHCRATTDRLVQCGHATLLRDAWRTFVHGCSTQPDEVTDARFRAGTHLAEIRDGLLILTSPGQTRRISLPKGTRLSFSVPPQAGRPTSVCVLHVHSTVPLNGKDQTHSLDIVACTPNLPEKNGLHAQKRERG